MVVPPLGISAVIAAVGLLEIAVVVPPLGILAVISAVGLLEIAVVVPPLGIAAVIAEVGLLEIASVVPPLGISAVIAFGVSNLGHPKYFASPNACSFPSYSSSAEVVAEVFVGGPIDVLPNDDPCSHSSNLMVSLYKKMERFDSSPNLNYSAASDTIALPTDATTNHCRKRCPHLSQGQHRHTSQVALPPLEVRQIR